MTKSEPIPLERFATRPLVVRVGAIGHRPRSLPDAQIPRVQACCREALIAVTEAAAGACDRAFFSSETPALRVLSSLAEGADRLVAEVALELGADLQCPLPFPREEFSADFADANSRQHFLHLLKHASAVFELDGTRADPEAAYEQAGQTLLAQSDVLLAVWDGTQSGKRGGTSQLVETALGCGVPVIWIHALDSRPAQLLHRSAGRTTEAAPLTALSRLLVPALSVTALDPNPDWRATVDYFGAHIHRLDFSRWATAMKWLLHRLYLPGAARARTESGAGQHPQAPTALQPTPIQNTRYVLDDLDAYFGRTDRLAVHFGALHRSSYVIINLGAAAAVAFAVASFFWSRTRVFASLELLSIGLVLGVSMLAWRGRWHEHWLDFRQLAERLRQLKFLSMLAANGPASAVPVYWDGGRQARRWIDGAYQALVRDIGLPGVTVDRAFLKAMRDRLQAAVVEQMEYHRINAELIERIDLSLRRTVTALFIATLGICALHIMGSEPINPWLVLGPATFPALAAALYAIRKQGDFARLAQRSAALESEFQSLANALATNGQLPTTLAELRRVALEVADITNAEILDWRFVFRFRPLTLPR